MKFGWSACVSFWGWGLGRENFCVSFFFFEFFFANFFCYPPQGDKEMLVTNPFDGNLV